MKNLQVYEAFGVYGPPESKIVTAQEIQQQGLKKIIEERAFLKSWLNMYFQFHYEDPTYDFMQDYDFWNHTDEILGTEDALDDEADLLHDEYWAKVLTYIMQNWPNPTEKEALSTAITTALA